MDEIMQPPIADGTEAVAKVMAILPNASMRVEREGFLGTRLYECNPDRRSAGGCLCNANSTQRNRMRTLYGRRQRPIPKTRNHPDGVPFNPNALGKR